MATYLTLYQGGDRLVMSFERSLPSDGLLDSEALGDVGDPGGAEAITCSRCMARAMESTLFMPWFRAASFGFRLAYEAFFAPSIDLEEEHQN